MKHQQQFIAGRELDDLQTCIDGEGCAIHELRDGTHVKSGDLLLRSVPESPKRFLIKVYQF